MRVKSWQQGIVVGILALAAFWLVSLIWSLLAKAHIAISQANDAKRQYAEFEARKQALESNLNTLQTPLGQDAAIRTAFGVAKPGEEEIIVVVPPATTTATGTVPWWWRLFGWF